MIATHLRFQNAKFELSLMRWAASRYFLGERPIKSSGYDLGISTASEVRSGGVVESLAILPD